MCLVYVWYILQGEKYIPKYIQGVPEKSVLSYLILCKQKFMLS